MPRPFPALAFLALLPLSSPLAAGDDLPDTIESIRHLGPLVRECSLPGETRKEDVVPRHGNALQVARQRWLIVYATHGFRGVDDERSIVYQLRRDAPDGPVVREGFLVRARDDWRPEGVPPPPEGKTYFKQHGHAVAFGVPRGAVLDGKPLPHANLFVAKWRVLGRVLDRKRDYLEKNPPGSLLDKRTQAVEWVQFRLNDREDDIEVVQAVCVLRQKGYEKGDSFTSVPVAAMNQSFCPAVPFNRDASEWVDCNHFDGGRLAVLRYKFDPRSRLYEWVQTGPLLSAPKTLLSEASLVRLPDGWLVAARSNAGGVAWAKSADPFKGWPEVTITREPAVSAPLLAFACPDGGVRLFTGDRSASPYKYDRDPLYCWDVDVTSGFRVRHRQTILDSVEAKLPIRRAARAKLDFCKLFPHHGRTQIIAHSVSTRAFNHPYPGTSIPPVRPEEKDASGIYYAKITYRKEPPPLWHFAEK